jgi:hypothetical protein
VYPAAIFWPAEYTHGECIRRGMSVYGRIWGYPAEIEGIRPKPWVYTAADYTPGQKIAFAEYPGGYPASAYNWVYTAEIECIRRNNVVEPREFDVLRVRVYGEKLSANSLHSATLADYTLNGSPG